MGGGESQCTGYGKSGCWVVAKDTGECVYVSFGGAVVGKPILFNSFEELSIPLNFRCELTQRHEPLVLAKSPRGRKQKVRCNKFCYELINDYPSLESAALNYPFIDDIVEGVCSLDWGGVRGLVPWKIFLLLSTLEVISAEEVRQRTWLSERHSRRIAEALRICAEAIEVGLSKFNGKEI